MSADITEKQSSESSIETGAITSKESTEVPHDTDEDITAVVTAHKTNAPTITGHDEMQQFAGTATSHNTDNQNESSSTLTETSNIPPSMSAEQMHVWNNTVRTMMEGGMSQTDAEIAANMEVRKIKGSSTAREAWKDVIADTPTMHITPITEVRTEVPNLKIIRKSEQHTDAVRQNSAPLDRSNLTNTGPAAERTYATSGGTGINNDPYATRTISPSANELTDGFTREDLNASMLHYLASTDRLQPPPPPPVRQVESSSRNLSQESRNLQPGANNQNGNERSSTNTSESHGDSQALNNEAQYRIIQSNVLDEIRDLRNAQIPEGLYKKMMDGQEITAEEARMIKESTDRAWDRWLIRDPQNMQRAEQMITLKPGATPLLETAMTRLSNKPYDEWVADPKNRAVAEKSGDPQIQDALQRLREKEQASSGGENRTTSENNTQKIGEDEKNRRELADMQRPLEQEEQAQMVNEYLKRTGMEITAENLPEAMRMAADMMESDINDKKKRLTEKQKSLLKSIINILLTVLGTIAHVGIGTGTEIAKKTGALDQFVTSK